MLAEVLQLLDVQKGDIVVDGTVGHGGHAEAMAELAGNEGELIGFDWDGEMLRIAEANLEKTEIGKTFVNADYRALPNWIREHRPQGVDKVLLDFGVNLQHFQDVSRGFSFQGDAALDMRMDRSTKETAAAWLNRASEGEIARALREYGGELWSGPIAKRIVARRKEGTMKTTSDLADAVFSAIPPAKRDKRVHPATRTFQAVRIAINRELENLEESVAEIVGCLAPGGRIATLSYHSGEDAAAKNAFRKLAKDGDFTVLTKKPLRPTEQEIQSNPNARSARLRALERGKS
jgi:16S rRNA (cytosine1402-N4)-methyltransferase